VTVCFDRGGWSPALFAGILDAGFDLLTYRKGPAPDLPAAAFAKVTCTDDRGQAHEYALADTTVDLDITEGSRKGQQVTLRQVTRRVPARRGQTRQIHTLTSRTGLAAAEVCWRMSSRWREENYLLARNWFALDALDSYTAAPDDPHRPVPNPEKKAAAVRVQQAEAAAADAEADRDTALLKLHSPAPGQAVTITNPVLNALNAPAGTACQDLARAEAAGAAVPARVPLGDLSPDMVRLDAETRQITHATRMAAYNTQASLVRALAALCQHLSAAKTRYPGTDLMLCY
jgi:hypothetical protein